MTGSGIYTNSWNDLFIIAINKRYPFIKIQLNNLSYIPLIKSKATFLPGGTNEIVIILFLHPYMCIWKKINTIDMIPMRMRNDYISDIGSFKTQAYKRRIRADEICKAEIF